MVDFQVRYLKVRIADFGKMILSLRRAILFMLGLQVHSASRLIAVDNSALIGIKSPRPRGRVHTYA
jgi:hypothetical protein